VPKAIKSVPVSTEMSNENLLFIDFHESIAWLKRLKQGLDSYFFDSEYDLFDVEFYLGFPSYIDQNCYGYYEQNFKIDGNEISAIFIAPGIMNIDQIVACVFHELIHAYAGVYGHASNFKNELTKFRVKIGSDSWEIFDHRHQRALSTILNLIGKPPYGLVNEFNSAILSKVQKNWALSSLNYCPVCFKKNIRFFSELRQKKLCDHSKKSHISLGLPPSYLPSNVFLDADFSWPWFGSLSPKLINHEARVVGLSLEIVVLDSFAKRGLRMNIISICPSQNSFKIKNLNGNRWKLIEKHYEAIRVSTDADFDLIIFNFREKYEKILGFKDDVTVSQFIKRVNDITPQRNMISITTLK
jgi:hypothetical protein